MSNVDSARSAYEAFGRGDLETLKEMLTEDGTWLTSDELPLGGETHGRDAIVANFARIPDYWSTFSVEPQEFIEAGDWVVVRGTQRIANDRGSAAAPYAHLIKFEDGRIARGEFYADTAKAAKLLA